MSDVYFNTRLIRVTCIEKGNEAGDHIEFYAGQQITIDQNDPVEKNIAQTFTVGEEPDRGYEITTGETITIKDLELALKLPPMTQGESSRLLSSHFYGFEHDSKKETLKTKKAFSNKLIEFIAEIPEEQDGVQAIKDFLDGDAFANAQIVPTEFTKLPLETLNLLEGIIEGFFANDDDVLGRDIIRMLYRINSENTFEYRFDFGQGFGTWLTGERQINHEFTLKSINKKTEVQCTLQIQITLA
jgi:hypothetical protein